MTDPYTIYWLIALAILFLESTVSLTVIASQKSAQEGMDVFGPVIFFALTACVWPLVILGALLFLAFKIGESVKA